MQSFRDILSKELIYTLIPSIGVAILLVVAFILCPKLLCFLELKKVKNAISIVLIALFLLNAFWSYANISSLVADLNENSFITYKGEVEYLSNKSNKSTSTYRLIEANGVCVETTSGKYDATIQKCIARIIYSKHSKLIVDFEVYEIIETRLPINIH